MKHEYIDEVDSVESIKIFAADEYLCGPTIDRETRVIEHGNPISLPSLENIDDNFQKKQKEKRKQSKESPKNDNKKLKT